MKLFDIYRRFKNRYPIMSWIGKYLMVIGTTIHVIRIAYEIDDLMGVGGNIWAVGVTLFMILGYYNGWKYPNEY